MIVCPCNKNKHQLMSINACSVHCQSNFNINFERLDIFYR